MIQQLLSLTRTNNGVFCRISKGYRKEIPGGLVTPEEYITRTRKLEQCNIYYYTYSIGLPRASLMPAVGFLNKKGCTGDKEDAR